MSKIREFVRYTKQGKLIPGSLIVTTNGGYPDKSATWKEVSTDLCCGGGGECTAPVVLTAPLYGFTTRSGFGPAILCNGNSIITGFGFLGSAPDDTWANIIADANDKLSWIGTWELGDDEIILNMDCNFYTFLQTLCPGEITLFATSA